MTLAQVQALLVGETVLYTPTGEPRSQMATVLQNAAEVVGGPQWLRLAIHDPGTASDWHLDYVVSGDIPTLSVPP
jgi:hypothetical protein